MAVKYLDTTGVKTLWSKIKDQDAATLKSAKSYAGQEVGTQVGDLATKLRDGTITVKNAQIADKASSDSNGNLISSTYVKNSLKGVASGIATLDASGKVPSSQLPSYVDDVLEYDNLSSFPATGETGKIYVAKDTNKIYRYSGSQYTVISETLSLGTTSSTAYSGASGVANEKAIAALKSNFTGDAANKALAIVSQNGNELSYDSLHEASIRANRAVIGELYGSDAEEESFVSHSLTDFHVVHKVSDTNITGYFEVTDIDSCLGSTSNLYLGYINNGKYVPYNESVYIYGSDNIILSGGSTPVVISSTIVKVGTSDDLTDLNVYGQIYVNDEAVLTQGTVQTISASELNEILV